MMKSLSRVRARRTSFISTLRANRVRRGGYTLIEVMIAVGLITVGSVGIMGLQTAALRANSQGRQRMLANQITSTWIDRLRRDTFGWTAQGTPVNTVVLQQLTVTTPTTGWISPATVPGEFASFDWQGVDTNVAADVRFCSEVRLTWIYNGTAMRADVRTWWVRRDFDSDFVPFANCAGGDPSVATGELLLPTSRIKAVHANTILRFQAPR